MMRMFYHPLLDIAIRMRKFVRGVKKVLILRLASHVSAIFFKKDSESERESEKNKQERQQEREPKRGQARERERAREK